MGYKLWRDAPDVKHGSRLYNGIHAFARTWHAHLVRLQCKGREHVPRDGGLVVACNHFTWWDPIVLSNVLPRQLSYLAKSELWRGPLTSRFFDAAGCIPVDRKAPSNAAAFQAALDALKAERVIGVFPEGTRSRPGALLPPKPGAARLALLSGAPVLPVGVATDRFWETGRKVPSFREPVYVAIGEPVTYDYGPAAAEDRDVVAKVSGDVMDRIAGLVDEAMRGREAREKWA